MENNNLQQLVNEQDLIGTDLDGLNGLSEMYPVIQWGNRPKSFETKRKRGGFFMTADNADAAGNYPKGAEADVITFEPTKDAPTGSEEHCFFTETLTFAPLATRTAWFIGSERLPRDFDYKAASTGRDKPFSKRQILALVDGENGPFVAILTFRSTVAADAQNALGEHNRTAQKLLTAAGVKNKAVKTNGWRWFWTTWAAADVELRGKEGAQSGVTPLKYQITGAYIGNELKAEFFDADTARAFESAWNDATPAVVVTPAQVASASAALYPETPDGYPEF